MNDGLYVNNAEGQNQLEELTSTLQQMKNKLDEIDSKIGVLESGWSGDEGEKVITTFKTHKTDLYTKMEVLEAEKKALQETYDAFSEARVNL